MVAATVVVAELRTSRKLRQLWFELQANSSCSCFPGYWVLAGLPAWLAGFVNTPAPYRVVKFDGHSDARKGRGSYRNSGPGCKSEALRDLGSLKSSFHLLAWRLGAPTGRLVGTQTQMLRSLEINYLLSSPAQLPLEPTCEAPTLWSAHGGAAMEDAPPAEHGASKRSRPEDSQAR